MRLLFLYFLIFSFNNLFAQDRDNFEFVGALKLLDENIISYKINFSLKPDGKIEGYSTTDFFGANSTKSKITGLMNEKKNEISFSEMSNLSTKSKAIINEFCYVNVLNAKIGHIKGKKTIQGSFYGKYNNDTNCAKGSISLMEPDLIRQIANSLNSKKSIDSLKQLKSKYIELNKTGGVNHINALEQIKINCTSREIILEIRDEMIEDMDSINIFLNGTMFMENFELKNEKKILKIPGFKGELEIMIVALNEGRNPPNTVNFALIDGGKPIKITSVLKRGESTKIVLSK